jgi:hypothetical protein
MKIHKFWQEIFFIEQAPEEFGFLISNFLSQSSLKNNVGYCFQDFLY